MLCHDLLTDKISLDLSILSKKNMWTVYYLFLMRIAQLVNSYPYFNMFLKYLFPVSYLEIYCQHRCMKFIDLIFPNIWRHDKKCDWKIDFEPSTSKQSQAAPTGYRGSSSLKWQLIFLDGQHMCITNFKKKVSSITRGALGHIHFVIFEIMFFTCLTEKCEILSASSSISFYFVAWMHVSFG